MNKFTAEEMAEFFKFQMEKTPEQANPVNTFEQLRTIAENMISSGYLDQVINTIKISPNKDPSIDYESQSITGLIIGTICSSVQLGREFESYRNMWTKPTSDKVN